MKISLILIFISSLLLSQDQDKQLRNFFNSLNNKTILAEIIEENSSFNANISSKDSKIYFETVASDSTISLFEKNLITSFDLSQKKIIIESSEKNILDFFAYENFENASLIKVEKENENSIYSYNFYDNILLIIFNNSENMVSRINLIQTEKIIFECIIVEVNNYQNPLEFFNIDDSWTTIDWRLN